MLPDHEEFDAVFERIRDLPGWLTRDQAAVLFAAAAAIPAGGRALEIGSHEGRSAIVLAAGLPPGARLTAVDPFPDDWRYGARGTEARFRANLERCGVAGVVDVEVATSRATRRGWSGTVDLLYIDGKHDYWTVRDDLRWSSSVPRGGLVFVHDAFSSLGVTTALLRELATSRTLRYRGRTGSLACLERRAPTPSDRLRPLVELPWWLRNLVVKVLLRLRLRPATRLLGHRDTADPY